MGEQKMGKAGHLPVDRDMHGIYDSVCVECSQDYLKEYLE